MPKTDSKAAVQDPTLCSEDPQAVWNGSDLLQMQRRQKPNTRNRPEKKKKRNQNQEERKVDKGANKETARKLAGNFGTGGTEDGKESRSDEKLGYRKCMQLWGKEPGTVS